MWCSDCVNKCSESCKIPGGSKLAEEQNSSHAMLLWIAVLSYGKPHFQKWDEGQRHHFVANDLLTLRPNADMLTQQPFLHHGDQLESPFNTLPQVQRRPAEETSALADCVGGLHAP